MSHPTLIISYFFPPYPGVGGRRWAKFAKYLARNGTTVHVVCAKNPFSEVSNWSIDVDAVPNLTIHRLPALYPRNLLGSPRTFMGRAAYRVTGMALGLVTRGAMFDHGVLWRFLFVREAAELIRRHEIVNVIATGAPFHVLFHALKLKKAFPDIRLISDLRDPWSDERRYVAGLPSARLAHECGLELAVIRGSDVVTTPSEHMTGTLSRRAATDRTRFVTLCNGFDPDDLPTALPERRPDGTIRFAYTGTLYDHLADTIIGFFGALRDMKKETPELYGKLRFSFFGDFPETFRRFVDQGDLDVVRRVGLLPVRKMYEELSQCDYGILFMPDDPARKWITKAVDYIALRKKIVAFGPRKEFAEELEREGVGQGCDVADIRSTIESICGRHLAEGAKFNPDFDIERHSLPRLAGQLMRLLT